MNSTAVLLAHLVYAVCSRLRIGPHIDEPLASIYRLRFPLSRGSCRISCSFAAGAWSALSVSLVPGALTRARQMSFGWVGIHSKDSSSEDCSTCRYAIEGKLNC